MWSDASQKECTDYWDYNLESVSLIKFLSNKKKKLVVLKRMFMPAKAFSDFTLVSTSWCPMWC